MSNDSPKSTWDNCSLVSIGSFRIGIKANWQIPVFFGLIVQNKYKNTQKLANIIEKANFAEKFRND